MDLSLSLRELDASYHSAYEPNPTFYCAAHNRIADSSGLPNGKA